MSLEAKIKEQFEHIAVNKSSNANVFKQLNLPAYIRDWFIRTYGDEDGNIDPVFLQEKIRNLVPRKENWNHIMSKLINEREEVKILSKISIIPKISTNEFLFELIDQGVTSKDTYVLPKVIEQNKKDLLSGKTDIWGILTLENMDLSDGKKPNYKIVLTDYKSFQPYKIDLEHYRAIREEFSLEEWIDVILGAIDYNPEGFDSIQEKLTLLRRLLPFIEPRVNLIELAPKGTGKSYVFSQISKRGWLNNGGVMTRAKLIYNMSTKQDGLIANYDYVALDEISSTQFSNLPEIQSALKGYLESGTYSVGVVSKTASSGLVLLGNIPIELMDTNKYFIQSLLANKDQKLIKDSAVLDRFHGFIEGWEIGRMTNTKRMEGFGVNTEYFSEIMHELRNEVAYLSIVNDLLDVPADADIRDTQAIKKLTTAFHKLLFPHWIQVEEVDKELYNDYCLTPAIQMRSIIKKQLQFMDSEYKKHPVPNITLVKDPETTEVE